MMRVVSLSSLRAQVRRCMEVLGRFQYHVIGGATGSGKGKLLDTLTAQKAQVLLLLLLLNLAFDLPLPGFWACDLPLPFPLPLWWQACQSWLLCCATACSCFADALDHTQACTDLQRVPL